MSTVKDIQIESALLERIFFQCEAYINGNNSSLVHKEKRVRHHSSKVNIINVPFNDIINIVLYYLNAFKVCEIGCQLVIVEYIEYYYLFRFGLQ